MTRKLESGSATYRSSAIARKASDPSSIAFRVEAARVRTVLDGSDSMREKRVGRFRKKGESARKRCQRLWRARASVYVVGEEIDQWEKQPSWDRRTGAYRCDCLQDSERVKTKLSSTTSGEATTALVTRHTRTRD